MELLKEPMTVNPLVLRSLNKNIGIILYTCIKRIEKLERKLTHYSNIQNTTRQYTHWHH